MAQLGFMYFSSARAQLAATALVARSAVSESPTTMSVGPATAPIEIAAAHKAASKCFISFALTMFLLRIIEASA